MNRRKRLRFGKSFSDGKSISDGRANVAVRLSCEVGNRLEGTLYAVLVMCAFPFSRVNVCVCARVCVRSYVHYISPV